MKIMYRNEGEYQAIIARLDILGFRWNTGNALKKLYKIPSQRKDKDSLVPMVCNHPESGRVGKPAVIFGNYIDDDDVISATEFILEKPVNYALTKLRELREMI